MLQNCALDLLTKFCHDNIPVYCKVPEEYVQSEFENILPAAICSSDEVLPDWRQSGGDCDARGRCYKNQSWYHNYKKTFWSFSIIDTSASFFILPMSTKYHK